MAVKASNWRNYMALTKIQKNEVISEVADLLSASKLTVVAKYEGTGVKALQGLRRDAKGEGTKVKVVKNRLVIQALKSTDKFKDTDTSEITGMLLYAFNSEDEVAPAKVIADFRKNNEGKVEFLGGILENRYIDAQAVSEPWCMCFVQACIGFVENALGIDSMVKATESVKSFVPNEIPKYFPRVGDVALWVKYNGTGHCGIVVKLNEDGSYDTIEGNTSDPKGFDRDGNGVYRKTRHVKDMGKYKLAGFVKVF